MNKKYLCQIFICLFFFFGKICLTAQLEQKLSYSIPTDKDKNWVVAFCQLKGQNLSAENQYLTTSLPLLFREKLIACPIHRFNDEEIIVYKKAILANELKEQIEKLAELQKKRDNDLLTAEKDFQREKIKKEFAANSQRIIERIRFLRELDYNLIYFPKDKAIEFKDQTGKLFSPPDFSALPYSQKLKVNLLVWGILEEIQGYLYCEINFFDSTLQKNILQLKEAGTRNEIFENLQTKIRDCITALLGYTWASLIITVKPDYSFIKKDGRLLGIGSAELRFIEPGELNLDISSPGYKPVLKSIQLQPYEEINLKIDLERTSEEYMLIQSIPSEAKLYLDSQYIGTTPFILQKPQNSVQLLIKLDGYLESQTRLGPNSAEIVTFYLIKNEYELAIFQDKSRARFYNSLTAFLLSIPLPIFCYNLAIDFASINKLAEWEFFSVGYFFSLFITGSLLVNTIIELLRYSASFGHNL